MTYTDQDIRDAANDLDSLIDGQPDDGALGEALTPALEILTTLLGERTRAGARTVKEVAEDGSLAFWKVVADSFPEATSGDFPPEADLAFRRAIEHAMSCWLRYNHPALQEGARVHLVEEVDRFPDFLAPKGNTGTVVKVLGDEVVVECDETIEGAEQWANHIEWRSFTLEALEHINEYLREVAYLKEAE